MQDIILPEVGENIESGTVVSVLVKVGDKIAKGAELIELETDKASLPVPAPVGGVIKEILVGPGEDVKIGAVIMRIEAGAESAPAEKPAPAAPAQAPAAQSAPAPAAKPAVVAPQPAAAADHAAIPSKEEAGKDTQLVVIGGGPGGYAAAFLAADLGLDVTLVDLEKNPGGVCLYRGCIPSKALLHAAKVISEAREASEFGVTFSEPKVDIDKLRGWKEDVVNRLTGGTGQLAKQRQITMIQGRARFVDSNTLDIDLVDGGKQTLTYVKAILATGSRPIKLPFAPDSERVLDSTSALEVANIPKTMLLIGGGYIGLELGQFYAEMGCKVSVVEMLPQIMTGSDPDLSNILKKRLTTIMDKIMVSTKVTKMEETSGGIKVAMEDKDGKAIVETYEKILVAIGRKPNSDDIGLENTQVVVNDRGFVEVNSSLQTADPSIYAIGDIAGNPMLAHKASHEGRVAVEHIAGHKAAFEPNAIPAVVFTDPEMAWAGLTEGEAKEQGINYVAVKFPWGASGRAITLNRVDGMTKMIVDADTERVLGVAIVGPNAGEMIAEGVLAIEMGATVTDVKMSIHAHPTLTETVMEAAESFFGQATHIYRPRKK
ncbi:MAG: dihydrolipoyl dehydrogenase [Candidatus Omnitrophica bacterium]|nr:dihydrolipoyl dehydrogenase [Candidatus Omnitrophota bacterium]MCB9719263.1 dihydrolipoyl dehydrogenase [Candidatus Omnitrophota bacterium]